jgi:hypothetical protein
MTIKFKSFDIHSGLREVKWAFGVYENKTVLIEKAVGITPIDTLVSNIYFLLPMLYNLSKIIYGNQQLSHGKNRMY